MARRPRQALAPPPSDGVAWSPVEAPAEDEGGVPSFEHEDEIGGIVAGVDEAGRGPLAGPVVAAAVVLDRNRLPDILATTLNDSKQLSLPQREALYDAIAGCARHAVGIASVEEIDEMNILRASLLAMVRAVDGLGMEIDCALIDGNQKPPLACRAHCLVRGDSLSFSVAAASVVAKVTRDRMMTELANMFPGYGWETNMGYSTPEHFAALDRLGVTPHHRRSFAPIARKLGLIADEAPPDLFADEPA